MRRGRFAPTPSGQLHIGNAWTALLAWLQMRHIGGEFVLRMEDIDKPRSRNEYAEQILDDLRWMGLDWDEGPDIGGSYGSYTQSERESLYEEALAHLQGNGRLYPCTCTRAELKSIASAPHGLSAEGPIYQGHCRSLTPEERAVKEAARVPSLRFAMPAERELRFVDRVVGEQCVPADIHGDFVIKRADGIIAYQLAVVVDDAAMKITDVLRGSDLLDSTPRQLMLYEALGLEAPQFCHVPLLCGPDGERLSKRNGAVTTIEQMRATGTRPEQVIGWLAYLSNMQDRPEPVQAAELIEAFDLSRLPKETVTVSEKMLRELHCL